MSASSTLLPHVIIPSATPNPHHTATCIFLHGLGDSGHGWASVAMHLSRHLPFIKFILPHAPMRRVTLNGGASMPAWYDIFSLDRNSRQDQSGILDSTASIQRFIDNEIAKGISADRIVIGGFSQGGAIALTSGLNQKSKLAGILALSTYLPIHTHFKALHDQGHLQSSTPIYMAHGTSDQVITYEWAKESLEYLNTELNCSAVEFETFRRMEHSVCDQELESIQKFLNKILGSDKSKSEL